MMINKLTTVNQQIKIPKNKQITNNNNNNNSAFDITSGSARMAKPKAMILLLLGLEQCQ
jgi:hypothetical protein